MSETYKKIIIEGKENLPASTGRYDIVFNDNHFGTAQYDKPQVRDDEIEKDNLNKLTSDELFKLVLSAESKYKKLLRKWNNSLYDNSIDGSHNYSNNNITTKSKHGRRHVGCGKPGGSKRH